MKEYVQAITSSRSFVLIWWGQTTSQLGDALYDVALVWLALQVTHGNPASVGIVIFAKAVPYLFVGLLAGAYSDRWNRKCTMVISDVLRGLFLLVLPALQFFITLNFWYLAAIACILTIFRSFFHPSLNASIPSIVSEEHLVPANAALHASFQTVAVLGPVAAGFLLTFLTPYHLFVLDAITFAVSAITIFWTQIPHSRSDTGTDRPHVFSDIASTAQAVYRQPVVFWSIALFGVGLLAIAGLLRVGLPIYTQTVLHAGSQIYGFLVGAMGLGTVLGALVIGKVRSQRKGILIFIGWMLWGAFFALLGLSQWLPLALIFALLAGSAEAEIDVLMVALLKSSVPQERLGKVFSFWSTIAFVGDSFSGLLIGYFIALVTAIPVFVGGGLAAVVIGLFGLLQVTKDTSKTDATDQTENRGEAETAQTNEARL